MCHHLPVSVQSLSENCSSFHSSSVSSQKPTEKDRCWCHQRSIETWFWSEAATARWLQSLGGVAHLLPICGGAWIGVECIMFKVWLTIISNRHHFVRRPNPDIGPPATAPVPVEIEYCSRYLPGQSCVSGGVHEFPSLVIKYLDETSRLKCFAIVEGSVQWLLGPGASPHQQQMNKVTKL